MYRTVRLNILVEGQTEETFARDLLSKHLESRKIYVTPICLGGIQHYSKIRGHIQTLLGDRTARLTTIV